MSDAASGGSRQIGFRISGAELERLQARAAEQEVSPGVLAKRLVQGALRDQGNVALQRELEELRHEVQVLRQDMAASLSAVLLNLANASEAEVRKYVLHHLGKR